MAIDKEIALERKHHWYQIIFCVLLLLVAGMVVIIQSTADRQRDKRSAKKETVAPGSVELATPVPSGDAVGTSAPIQNQGEDAVATEDPAANVYTYLQGPKSWKSRLDWSGKWGKTMYDGGSFGAFGCGLCCLANIYSTDAEGECSPIDMYRYTKKYTEYGGGGAIAWEYMLQTLKRTGFTAELCQKPGNYEEFRSLIAESRSSIVLVSSADSTCYWKDTPGHYVTVFLYDDQTERIFLADSGDPKHNRHWVKLKKIYKSLKTDSDYQYLRVMSYVSEQDQWKHTKASGTWVRPNHL